MAKSRINTPFDEAIFWMDQSLAYFESSKILIGSSSEYKSMPIITLQSFSIECSLKALLLLVRGKYQQKHDSLSLFELLPEEVKVELTEHFFKEFEFDLKDALIKIRSDFIESRYSFVQDFKKSYVGRIFHTGYLEVISESLIGYIRENGDVISDRYGHSTSVTCSHHVTFSTTLEP